MTDTMTTAYHQTLMRRMAETLGLDLDVEMAATKLSRRQMERALDRCTSCADPAGCEMWLDEHTGGATQAPALCQNKVLLEHLRESY